ncbi:MAG: sugar ABC transporter substrate-binding protein, partial [Thermofilum sp. ex4484_15]
MHKKLVLTLAIILILLTPTISLIAQPKQVTIKEWLAEVSKPYRGITITWITESTPPSLFIRDVLAPEFEKITGIKVKVEATSWDEMYRKSIADMEAKTGIYDLVYVEQDIIAFYAAKGYLTDIRTFPKKLWYPNYDIWDIFSLKYYVVNDKILAVPFETFIKVYAYRKDLFNDPKERATFKAKYGWDLRPPRTWEEYKQIAEFFYRPKQGLYGHVAQAATHPCLFYEVVAETIFPTFGVHYWGITLKRRASVEEGGSLNSPAAVAALTMYIDLLKYAPPGVRTYT